MTEDKSSLKVESHQPYKAVAGQVSISGSLTGAVPVHLVDDGEQIILAIKPSLWFIVFHSAPVFILVVLIFLGIQFFPISLPSDWCRYVMQIAVFGSVVQILVSVLQWMTRLYVLTDRRIMRIRGVFTVNVFEAPLMKVQNTYLTFAVHERIVGLGTVLIATAGTYGIEASWQNIRQPLEVHELIRAAVREANRRRPNGSDV
jgi:uncharacterized membrane protein YdbT with pleckstrin-like domain